MSGVLEGFFTIWAVIGAGVLLAHLKILDSGAQLTLSEIAFFLGNPALLGVMMCKAELGRVFSMNVIVSVIAILASAALYLVAGYFLWPNRTGHRVIATFCSSYVNAGNLGLPIAAYLLGDVTWIAPILLIQITIAQPIGLAMLDIERARAIGRKTSPWRNLLMPFRNPMTVATLFGLGVNIAGAQIPALILEPVNMIGAIAVPSMLLAFGVSLRLGGHPSLGRGSVELLYLVAVKLFIMPTIAWVVGVAFGLDRSALLAVTVIAGLPCAQNIFIHAVRFDTAKTLARDAIFITTIASVPTIMGITALVR